MIKISVWKRFEQKTCWRCGLADCPPASKFISNKETLKRVNCGSHICQDPLVQAIIQSGASGMFAAPKLQQTLCHYAIQVWHCTVTCLLTSLIQHTYQSNGGTWMICLSFCTHVSITQNILQYIHIQYHIHGWYVMIYCTPYTDDMGMLLALAVPVPWSFT